MDFSIKRIIPRRRSKEADASAAVDNVRITNETVAARRDEVLGSARKYIYPLQASKHRIVKWSSGIFIVAVVGFFAFCAVELYKLQSTDSFIYGVTRVLPFPIAVIGKRTVVSYNDYLFELRHYMHYYQSQQHIDFSTSEGKQQLSVFRQRSLDETLQNAYVEQLAVKNHITVNDQDVDKAVALVRSQNRLGATDQVFENVLAEFWGWTVDDFRRELRRELLVQKVVDKLDVGTHDRANQVLASLQNGGDFAQLAKQYSDDASTKASGGDYGIAIGRSNSDIAPQVIDQLFSLQPGQHSGIINTGYSLEIVKLTDQSGTTVHASHIAFNFKPITDYTKPLMESEKPLLLIHT